MNNERLAHLIHNQQNFPAPAGERFSEEELKDIKISIGKRLIEAYRTENYTAISEQLKTTPAIARLYALGERFPAPEMLIQFRRTTGMTTDWLLTGEEPKYINRKSAFTAEEIQQIAERASRAGRSLQDELRRLVLAGMAALENYQD